MRIIKPRSADSTGQAAMPAPETGQSVTAIQPPQRRASESAQWPGQELLHDPVTARILMSVWSADPVVVVPSPPGAGKTRLVVLLSAALAVRAGMRVGVAAQTRAQAIDLARRLAAVCDHTKIALLWKRNVSPDAGGCPIKAPGDPVWPRSGGAVRIATTARWLFADPDVMAADVLIVDEAYQATYADLGALGSMAKQVVLVGDPGQIEPVVTGDVSRWADSPTGPHLPAPIALAAAHPDVVASVALRHTYRLGPQTTALVQPAFYPDMPFTSRRPAEHVEIDGAVIPEMATRLLPVTDGPTDRGLVAAAVDRVETLLRRGSVVTAAGRRSLEESDIAVVVPHVAQAAAVRATLSDSPEVLVGTANSLQGLERSAVVAIHPLAGRRTAETFALDGGRLCVMLSRHRSHLSVLIDDFTPQLLADSEGEQFTQSRAVVEQLGEGAHF
ncbi:helicase [Mycolicibacterium fortuitum]|uniref:AAA family ATPase n=1 Tax=Mycolicibacterium fortuitum TaxID=1766 RepID=UPI0007EA41F2|nr:AAA family ATPase [Mycolicibacterium fortuitum]OBG21601.1 helicase [Mycolicibacterium fortuitum]